MLQRHVYIFCFVVDSGTSAVMHEYMWIGEAKITILGIFGQCEDFLFGPSEGHSLVKWQTMSCDIV